LFPPFQEILARDVVEFTPYVYQILSQLLALHTVVGIPDIYMSILGPLLQPPAWENHANIPALVNLLTSYLEKGSLEIAQKGNLPAFLGIFQKLLSSRINDHHGLNLCKAIFEYVPHAQLEPYKKNIFVLILTRIFQSKTSKFTRSFLEFLSYLVLLDNPDLTPDTIIHILDSVQPDPLFGGLLQNIILPEFSKVINANDRKMIALGMTRFLTASNIMLNQYLQYWYLPLI
jgi:exportin-2 (importin alpha re-exporter)